jgi:hypothetical protein
MTTVLEKEWRDHRTPFAAQWLSSMMSKSRVHFVESLRSVRLRRSIHAAAAATKKKEHDALEKDFHLVEAALATDKLIASLDEKVRKLFALAAGNVIALRKIVG